MAAPIMGVCRLWCWRTTYTQCLGM
jgi:hypothetical protein